ncbi:MAG: hypothetical protein IPK82_41230 [Polyangiaceae bacterium]|nr:hypothetical protein [Polyangiaceae bacterium]
MFRRCFCVVGAFSISLLVGCKDDKAKALDALEQIKEACAENDKDTAIKIAEEFYAKNDVFKKAYNATGKEPRKADNCSPLLHNEISTYIHHGG